MVQFKTLTFTSDGHRIQQKKYMVLMNLTVALFKFSLQEKTRTPI